MVSKTTLTFFAFIAIAIISQQNLLGQSDFSLKYNLDNGLPTSYTKHLMQLKTGELLVSTDNGLIVFDGYKFNQYSKKEGLPSQYVKFSMYDTQENIWVGTDGGLVKAQMNNGNLKFEKIEFNPYNKDEKAFRIFEDSQERIWIAAPKKIFIIERNSTHQLPIDIPESDLMNDYVRSFSFYEDTEKNVWISTLGGGLWCYNNEKLVKINNSPKVIRSIYPKSDSEFYLGTPDGLYSIKINRNAIENSVFMLKTAQLKMADTFERIGHDQLWIGTDGMGYVQYNEISNQIISRQSVGSEYVKYILKDIEGNVWIASDDGITLFPYSIFRNFSTEDGLPKRYVSGVSEDKHGQIWVSTYEGLFVRKTNGGKFQKIGGILDNKFIKAITYSVKYDKIYVCGTQELYEIECANFSLKLTSKFNQLNGSELEYVFSDPDGNLWMTTNTLMLLHFDLKSNTVTDFDKTGGLNSRITYGLTDNKKSSWFSGADRTLIRYDDETKKLVRFDWSNQSVKPDSTTTIDCLFMDEWNRLWLGTTESIYIVNQNKQVSKLDTKLLKNVDNIRFISGSGSSYWVATNRSLYLFYFNSPDEIKSVKAFGKKDGLNSTSFSFRACYQSHKNRLLMGTGVGASLYSGGVIHNKINSIKITSLKVDGMESSKLSLQKLNSGSHDISINSLTINFPNDDIYYQYRIVGLNDSWSAPTKNQSIDFTINQPGNYEFHVKAMTEGGLETNLATTEFSLPYPFYFQWYSILLYASITGFSIYKIVKYRSQILENKNRELEELISERTSEISERDKEIHQILGLMDNQGTLLSEETISVNQNIFIMKEHSLTQSSAIAQTTATMEELARSNKAIEISAESVSAMIKSTKNIITTVNNLAEKSTEFMSKLHDDNMIQVHKVQDLSSDIDNIRNISSFIKKLSDQTQVIAFNAAIEATISGEVGRRFKIIADEIRNLSDEINDSTKSINNALDMMIHNISDVVTISLGNKRGISEGVEINKQVSENFDLINTSAEEVERATSNITISVSQQSMANEQMVVSLQEIAGSSNELVEIIKDISKSSDHMKTVADNFLKIGKDS